MAITPEAQGQNGNRPKANIFTDLGAQFLQETERDLNWAMNELQDPEGLFVETVDQTIRSRDESLGPPAWVQPYDQAPPAAAQEARRIIDEIHQQGDEEYLHTTPTQVFERKVLNRKAERLYRQSDPDSTNPVRRKI